jgi:hypothetical protein
VIGDPSSNPLLLLPYVDVLVADGTSLSLYFPIFKRPMLHWDQGIEYLPPSLMAELKKDVYNINSISSLDQDIPFAISTFKPEVMDGLREKTFSHLGQARQRYKEEIYDSLGLSLG